MPSVIRPLVYAYCPLANAIRINEQMMMWIVTVVWYLDRNERPRTWCYSKFQYQLNYADSTKMERYNIFCWLIIDNLYNLSSESLSRSVLHSSKTHQHSSRRTQKTFYWRPANCQGTARAQVFTAGARALAGLPLAPPLADNIFHWLQSQNSAVERPSMYNFAPTWTRPAQKWSTVTITGVAHQN